MFITIFQLILGTDCLIVSHRLLCVNEYMRAQQKILKKKDVYENVSIALHLFKQHPAAGNLFLEIYRRTFSLYSIAVCLWDIFILLSFGCHDRRHPSALDGPRIL